MLILAGWGAPAPCRERCLRSGGVREDVFPPTPQLDDSLGSQEKGQLARTQNGCRRSVRWRLRRGKHSVTLIPPVCPLPPHPFGTHQRRAPTQPPAPGSDVSAAAVPPLHDGRVCGVGGGSPRRRRWRRRRRQRRRRRKRAEGNGMGVSRQHWNSGWASMALFRWQGCEQPAFRSHQRRVRIAGPSPGSQFLPGPLSHAHRGRPGRAR